MAEAERTPEHEAAIAVLKSYDEKFTAIMDLIGESNGLTGQKKQEAQDLLRELKEGLKTDCKEYERQRDNLDKYESCFVEPALRKASANIMSSVSSIPNQKMHSDLYGARVDITHALHELNGLPVDWSPAS